MAHFSRQDKTWRDLSRLFLGFLELLIVVVRSVSYHFARVYLFSAQKFESSSAFIVNYTYNRLYFLLTIELLNETRTYD